MSPPISRPLHEAAGEFAQSVIELQQHKANLEAHIIDLETNLARATARIDAMTEAASIVQQRLDYYHRRCVEIETKLAHVGSIILDVVSTSPREPAPGAAGRDKPAPDTITNHVDLDDLI